MGSIRARRLRTRSLRVAALLIPVFVACTKAPPPNVLLVTFDTTRYDRFGATGDPTAKTPVVDALAKRGVLFERAYASAGLTLPSHTTIMTGLEPYVHGVHNNGKFRVPDDLTTLAEHLKEAGFDTAAFVSAYVLIARFRLNQGFDVYGDETHETKGALAFGVPSRPGEEVVEAATEWLRERSGERPFFLWAHFYDPHQPNEPKPPYDQMSDAYAGEIAYADDQLGRLLDAIAKIEGERGTLIVFTADHGESLGAHGERTHGMLAYDSTLHVPLVVAGPGVEAGKRVSAYVRHADILPTILRAVGARVPGDLEGRDLLLRRRDDEDGVGYFESRGPHYDLGWGAIEGIRTARWKYTARPEPEELYDLRFDPHERRNLVEQEPEVRREMAESWEGFVARHASRRRAASLDDVSLEAMEKLAALGYVQAPQDFAEGERPDPRRFVRTHELVDGAREMARGGRFEGAIEILETLVLEPSVRAVVLRTLAPVYGESGRIEEAVKAYRDYIELTGAPEARLGLARMLIEARRPEDALATLAEIEEARGQPAMLRAYALARLGKREDARAAIDEGFPAPRQKLARLRLHAALVIDSAPLEEGERELRELLAEAPDDAELESRLGYYLAVWGRPEQAEQALAFLRAAYESSEDDPDLAAYLGWGAFSLGRYDEAVEMLETSLAKRPLDDLQRMRLGMALRRTGRLEEASETLAGVLRRRPAASWAEKVREELEAARRQLARGAAPRNGSVPAAKGG